MVEPRPQLQPSSSISRQNAVRLPLDLLRTLLAPLLSHLQIDEQWERTIRDAAVRGQVVYIGRSVSAIDFAALDHLIRERALPSIDFCNDLELLLALRTPIPDAMASFDSEEGALQGALSQQGSALLFLRRPPAIAEAATKRRKGAALETDLIRVLVEHQRKSDRPLILVPHTFVWTKRPGNLRMTWSELLFGPVEWPGPLRRVFEFLLNHRNGMLRVGETFDLGAYLAERPELSDEGAADAVRYALLRRLERERSLVLGPVRKTASRIRDEILRSPRVRREIAATARESNRPVDAVVAEARGELEKLCASMDNNVIDVFHHVLERFVWTQIYDGLIVDMEGLERLREAARKGPLVLLPSHKSHVDYLILSDVLYTHGIAPPLIAAGENLSFWPVGEILRRSGAFFIKRSFRGNKLYPQLVDAYVRKILTLGWNIEVFLEGGRSRTGKLLPPKLGILSMIVDGAVKITSRDVHFVPISIGYERIIEEGSYVHEQGGGEKKPESIGGLLDARGVLRSRYGRLYIAFGEILPFRELLKESLALAQPNVPSEADSLTPAVRRALIQRIAHRVTYEINRVTVVTPAAITATALMVHRRRGLTHGRMTFLVETLLETLRVSGARVARAICADNGELRRAALEETVRLFQEAKLLEIASSDLDDEPIYRVPDERRIALEYHKNTILHFFVPSALISSSLLAFGSEVDVATLRARVRELSRIFKFEFMYRADADYDAIFDDALAQMRSLGEVELMNDHVRRGAGARGSRVSSYAEMLRTYFESYRLTLIALRSLRRGSPSPIPKKEWVTKTLALGNRRWLSGQISLRESVSRSKIDTALAAWADNKIVRIDGDQLFVGSADEDEARRLDQILVMHLQLD